MMDILH